MNLIKTSAIGVLAALVGGLVGARLATGQGHAGAASVQQATSAQVQVLQARIETLQAQQAADQQVHREQVRASMYEGAVEGRAAPVPPAAPSAEPLTPEAEAALQRANDLIDQALENGAWGQDQVKEFREASMLIPVSQKMEVLRKLAAGINDGKVHVTAHGLPL